MLLGLPYAVFLGSESLGTRDHILLSQIWDFPFCRLLRLASSRWRYSMPPLHGLLELSIIVGFSLYNLGSDHITENNRCLAVDICEPHRKHLLRHRFYCCVFVLEALPRNGSTLLLVAYLLRVCLPSRSPTMGLHVTILTNLHSEMHDILVEGTKGGRGNIRKNSLWMVGKGEVILIHS
jgi:hypothetical protein